MYEYLKEIDISCNAWSSFCIVSITVIITSCFCQCCKSRSSCLV